MANISRNSFNETALYDKVIQQQGMPYTDYDYNELQDIQRVKLRRIVQELLGDGILTGFQVNPTTPTASMAVTVSSGTAYVNGYRVLSSSLQTFNVTAPGSGTRTDAVYLDISEVEINSTQDPNIKASQLTIEPTRRTKLQVNIVYAPGVSAAPVNTVTDSYYLLALVSVSTGQVTIVTGNITDKRLMKSNGAPGTTTNIGGNLSVNGTSLFTGDVTLMGNMNLQSGSLVSNGIFSGTTLRNVTLASTYTFTNSGTIVGGNINGATIGKNGVTQSTIDQPNMTGTWTGTPTFSGNIIFSGNPSFSGTPTFSGTTTFTAATQSLKATQIILGQTNNISTPATTIYLAPPNTTALGMDGYGNLTPISPASITTSGGTFWFIADKSNIGVLKAYVDGTKKVSTANNTLDDGSGNTTIAGNISATGWIQGAANSYFGDATNGWVKFVNSASGVYIQGVNGAKLAAATLFLTGYNNVTNTVKTFNNTLDDSTGKGIFIGSVTAPNFISNIAIGTAPFTVTSTTVVPNLNVDMVDGYHMNQDVRTTAGPTFAGLTLTGNVNVPVGGKIIYASAGTGILDLTASITTRHINLVTAADLTTPRNIWDVEDSTNNAHQMEIWSNGTVKVLGTTAYVQAPTFTSTVAAGTAPFTVTSTTKVTNLNVDLLDGYSASTTAVASTIPVYNGSAQLVGNITGTAIGLATARTFSWTGDVTGSVSFDGTANVTNAMTLANSGVIAGTYNNVTVNAKGIITGGSTVSYLTANQSITLSGDASGSGATAITVTLANSGVTAGTYAKVTVNAKGLVTGSAALASGDITTALGFTPLNKAGDTITGQLTSSVVTGTAPFVITSTTLVGNLNAQYHNGYATSAVAAASTIPVYNASSQLVGSITGNAATATALATGRTIGLSGDVTATGVTFDGTGNISLATTLANSGAIAGTYNNVTVNAKGLVTGGSNVAYLTANQSITLSGDVSGSGTTAITATLANSGVAAGTYKSVTVDAKGRVTGATNPTTLAGFGITDALPEKNSPSGGSTYYVYRDLAAYSNGAASQVGTIKITLPFSWTSTMMSIIIRGYDLSTNGAWTLALGGYNYVTSAAWADTSATVDGAAPFSSVRFAHDGTNCCILLGTTSTTWQYPYVEVEELHAGYSADKAWGTGWSISLLTAETGITISSTPQINLGLLADLANKLVTARTFTFTGDATSLATSFDGSANVSIGLTLKNTGTAGTYTKVTTDAQGRVTSGTALVSGDVTGALGFTPLKNSSDSMTGTLTVTGLITGNGGITIPSGKTLTANGTFVGAYASNGSIIGATADLNGNAFALSVGSPASTTINPFGVVTGGGASGVKAFYVTYNNVVATKNNTLDDGSGSASFGPVTASNITSSGTVTAGVLGGSGTPYIFFNQGYSTGASGSAQFIGNWPGTTYWGLGTDSSSTNSTVQLGVATVAGAWQAGTINLKVLGNVSGTTLTSTVAIGTAPLAVTSTTAVTNLNADMVDGFHMNQSLKTTDSPTFSGVSATTFTENGTALASKYAQIANAQMTKITNDSGGSVSSFVTTSDFLTQVTSLGVGLFTFYAPSGTPSMPPSNHSVRGIIQCTGTGFTYVWCTDYSNNIFTNYQDSGTWKGWQQLTQLSTLDSRMGTGVMIDKGSIALTPPSAGGTVSQSITFSQPFTQTPIIQVTPNTSLPEQCSVSFGSPTNTGFILYFNRTVVQSTSIHWSAIGN